MKCSTLDIPIPYPQVNIYEQTQVVNLEKNFSCYSFLENYPDQQKTIHQLFNQVIEYDHKFISVSSVLRASEFQPKHFKLLEKRLGFYQLSNHPERGVVLAHKDLDGWLIKKNFHFLKEGETQNIIIKNVAATDFPKWMLSPATKGHARDIPVGFQVINDFVHPLRVVMLERGDQWIKHLHLTRLQTTQEYLYELPTDERESIKPLLHERIVVISRKEDVLSDKKNLLHFVEMASNRPKELKELADQIARFIQHTFLTDMHLLNIRFLNDGTDTVIFLDGEPIGALADASQIDMIKAIKSFDCGFFSLLGLKKLKMSIKKQLEEEKIPDSEIKKVQDIFDQAIQPIADQIIRERRWIVFKENLKCYVSLRACLSSLFPHFKVESLLLMRKARSKVL